MNIHYKNIIILLISFGLVIIGPILTKPILAQQQLIDLTVSPPLAYIRIKPGSGARHTVTVTNTSREEVVILPKVVDFLPDGKTGSPVIQNTTTFPYLEMGSESFQNQVLAPGERAQLTLSILVPQGARDEEFPLTILFETLPTIGSSLNSGNYVQASVGSNLIVLVSQKDQLNYGLFVDQVGIGNLIDSFGRIEIKPIIENRAINAHVASGNITISNWQQKELISFPIFPDVILGRSQRQLRAGVKDSLDPQNPDLVPGEFIFKPPFLFGPYIITVELLEVTDDSSPGSLIRMQHTVFALPLSIIALIIVGILVSSVYWMKIKKSNLDLG